MTRTEFDLDEIRRTLDALESADAPSTAPLARDRAVAIARILARRVDELEQRAAARGTESTGGGRVASIHSMSAVRSGH